MYTASLENKQDSNQQRYLTLFERGYAIVSLLFFTPGLGTIFSDDPAIMSPLRYLILLLAGLFALMRWRSTLRAVQRGGLIWLLIGLTMISVMWSNYPDHAIESIRGEILPLTSFSVYFASRFHPREQLRLLSIALGIGSLISLFYVFAIPSIGTHTSGAFAGAWKGIYGQKNSFSAYMTITLVTFFVLSVNNVNRFERLICRSFLGLSIAMVILSTSKTGLVVFITILFLLLAYQRFRWQGKRTVFWVDVATLIALVAGCYVFSNWELLISSLGRDPTLTGRTLIWEGAFEKLDSDLWLGFGRESFWLEENPLSRGFSGLHDGYRPAHAHNGFIDLIVDLGVVGLVIFLIGYLATFALALRRSYLAKTPEDFWPIAVMLLILVYNMTESLLMKRANLFFVLYLINFFSLRLWPKSSS
ncbi:MAG: O-antigen ligase family protein, partial [Cyanobacteria bacterium P01_G01_bin.38]